MTQPHHHAFNALEAVFHRTVKISRLLPVLLSRGLLSSPTHDWLLAELRDEQNGIKVLTGYLRSKDYDTFVSFIECVFEAGTADLKLMESVREVVNDFDVKNKTTHAERIALIINEYSIKLQDDVDEESRPVEHKRQTITDLNLHFLNDSLIRFSFNNDGGIYHNDDFDVTIEAPPGVTGGGDHDIVVFELGICACGPFAIKEEFQVITGFICVETSQKLHKPVCVTLQHCLKMVKYEKTHSVIILKAKYQEQTSLGQYVFEPYWGYEVGDNRQEEKRQIVRPEISPDSPHLWFEIDEFCILCAVLKKDNSKSQMSSDSGIDSQLQGLKNDGRTATDSGASKRPPLERHPVTSSSFDNPIPSYGKSPSLEEDTTIQRSGSSASSIQATSPHSTMSAIEAHPDSSSEILDKKRKRSSIILHEDKRNNRYSVEYAVMFVGPSTTSESNKFRIFVCQYCKISIEECLRQAKVNTKSRTSTNHQLLSMYQGEFSDLELTITCMIDSLDWKAISDRTPVIKERDIHLQQRSYFFNDVKNMCSLGTYPPRLVFDVYARTDVKCVSPRTHCMFLIEGFKFSDTLETYFSIMLNKHTTSLTSNQSILIETKAGEVFQKYYRTLVRILKTMSTDTLMISTFLYSNWVIDFEEFREILCNDSGHQRATKLLDYLLEKIEENEDNLETVCNALTEYPVLTTLGERMQHEFGKDRVK